MYAPPTDPTRHALAFDFEQLGRGFVQTIPHVRACGMSVEVLRAAYAQVRLPYREDWLCDADGSVMNTGIITTLIDSAAGLAVFSALQEVQRIATLDLRTDYLRGAQAGSDLICGATCHRMTPQIAFVRASVWQADPEQPVALCQAAFMRSERSRAPVSNVEARA